MDNSRKYAYIHTYIYIYVNMYVFQGPSTISNVIYVDYSLWVM